MLVRVRRFAPIGALLAGLVLALPSAAQLGSGKIAFATTSGVFTINPDGSQRSQIGTGAGTVSWSPDGSMLAIVRPDFGGRRLYVADEDGGNERFVAEGSNHSALQLSDQPWSPDGAWIAFSDGYGIHRTSSAGGDVRTVTTQITGPPPVWSPTGSLLAYSSAGSQSNKLVVIAPDGTGRIEIVGGAALNLLPAWSPAGDAIAFTRTLAGEGPAIYVVRPDGSELHKVVSTDGWPVWSPNGTRIAFTSALGYNRRRSPITDVFSVAADGSTLRRLTNTLAGESPIWSPDGDRVLFESGGQLKTINADGSCEDLLEPFVQTSSWQPLPGRPPIGERRCAAVSVRGETLDGSGGSSIAVTIFNQGTKPLSRIRLVAFAPNGLSLSLDSDACSTRLGRVTCRVSRLERGEIRQLIISAHPRRFSRDSRSITVFDARLRVTAAEQLLRTGREADHVVVTARSCRPGDKAPAGSTGQVSAIGSAVGLAAT